MLKKCTQLWRQARLEVGSQNVTAPKLPSTFGTCVAQKVHAAVARSTLRSQNVKKHHTFGAVNLSFFAASDMDMDFAFSQE